MEPIEPNEQKNDETRGREEKREKRKNETFEENWIETNWMPMMIHGIIFVTFVTISREKIFNLVGSLVAVLLVDLFVFFFQDVCSYTYRPTIDTTRYQKPCSQMNIEKGFSLFFYNVLPPNTLQKDQMLFLFIAENCSSRIEWLVVISIYLKNIIRSKH